VTVIVGVDGSGRTHRLRELAAGSGRPVVAVDDPGGPPAQLQQRLEAAVSDGAVLLVDDAHGMPAVLLAAVARAARQGLAVVVARRPSITSPELADLDEAAAAQGGVERLEPLDEARTAAVIRAATGRTATVEQAAAVRRATGGLPALIALVAVGEPGVAAAQPARGVNVAFTPSDGGKATFTPPPGLVARVQRQLTRLEPPAGEIARALAAGLRVPDEVLAAATGVEPAAVTAALRELHDAGLLAVGGELIPVLAAAIRADIPPAELRRVHAAVGRGLLAVGGDPVQAAEQLSSAGASTPEAYLAAAERLRFDDAEAAVGWFDRALAVGADPTAAVVGRAEAAALLGIPVDLDAVADSAEGRRRLALVHGAVAAHAGRPARAADALLAAAPPGPVLAVLSLVAVGRVDEARAAAVADAPPSLLRFAAAVLELGDPPASLPLFIEAAEALEQSTQDAVLPDTPHALGAIAAVTAGDVGTAERLLQGTGVGGPVAALRHRLLLAWARMRAGRLDTANAELPKLTELELTGRERTLAAAVSAGLARRTGDVARQRAAWAAAEPVLARQAFDLLQVEALEELLVAAARMREHDRVEATLAQLEEMLQRWHRPTAWAVALGWVRVQVAVVAEDAQAAATAAEELTALNATTRRQRAQAVAAAQWARVLAGDVDPDAVQSAGEELAAGQLPWEASRLVGAAAIRIGDATAARVLLERARELSGEGPGKSAARGQLSEREVDVARLVLAGRTHREIGAQLYVSPKTVEHHVARIRSKLGATSRAELQAALRRVLADEG